MSGDLRLGGIGGAAVAGPEAQDGTLASQRTAFLAAPAPNATPAAASQTSRNPELPNPRLHTDLALNRLVLEFFDAQGALTNSIPSQKQLNAYRLAAFSGKAPRS